MKPIIVDMKDMSDTTEVYEARPNPALIYFIYLLLFMLAVILMWMYFSDIDIVVKSNGLFRCEETVRDVSCNTSGKVEKCNVSEGQFVTKGDILLTMNVESLEKTIESYDELLEDVNQRIEILNAYQKCLDDTGESLENFKSNKYYAEFVNRKELLETGINSSDGDTESRKKQYETDKANINGSIQQYEIQVTKLQQTKECIKNRSNIFDASDSYYSSMVESYISNYNVTSLQYDNQIKGYQRNIAALKEQIKPLDKKKNKENSDKEALKELKKQIEVIEGDILTVESEKEKALGNLELQQIAGIEQQIKTANETLLTLKSNETSVQSQLDAVSETEKESTEKIDILSEKNSISAELLTYESKKTEYENNLKQYNLENKKADIIADSTGYISLEQEIKEGTYLQEGSTVCQILPEVTENYYAEIYVENQDIAKLKEGQQVKFEIAAYPSSEYGYLTGEIDTISKDIKIDQNTGSAYYLVKVKCDNSVIMNKEGDTGNIMNGMACQARVIIDKQSVLRYLLEKIDLLD